MTDQDIEHLLRKSPQPNPPESLRQKLIDDIALPKSALVPPPGDTQRLWNSWLARWLPIGATALFLVTVFAFQNSTVTQLREENSKLRAVTAQLDNLRRENAEAQRLIIENRDLERLRRDVVEIEQLQSTVAQLRQQLQDVEHLRAENQALRQSLTIASAGPAALNEPSVDEDSEASDSDLSIACINHLKQIGLAVRIWATDNEDYNPTSVLQMSNELATPLILLCPADHAKDTLRESLRAQRWASFRPEDVSYQLILSGEIDETHPQRILSKCPIHGHVGLADGSVMSNPASHGFREELIDGRLTLVSPNQPVSDGSGAIEGATTEIQRLLMERYGLSPDQVQQLESDPAPVDLSTDTAPEQPSSEEIRRLMMERYGIAPQLTPAP